ncbi:MAG TPA: penicillin-binding transpeptidase domain-containing protein [Thermomicrobiales bacterium]|nr:penicillin-binding transpeptidase domain-containing protein [Thermomicrobiales bacterium]
MASPVPPAEIAERWVKGWSEGDYDALYDLIGARARAGTTRTEFVERYAAIAERAGLESVEAVVTGGPTLDNDIPIAVRFESSIVGGFSEENALPLVREADGWKVDWSPSTIFAGLGGESCVDVTSTPTPRGAILDRDGDPLAYDGSVQRVGVVPSQFEPGDESRVIRELADLTDLDEDAIRARYAEADPGWFVAIKDFPESRTEELLNVISRLPGVSVQPAAARIYPMGAAAAHVTGYVSPVTAEQIEADPTLASGQIVGQAGIEAGADDLLTGEPGVSLVVVGCESRAQESIIAERPPVPALDIVLTIDRDLQEATVAALRAQGDVRAAAVVLDPGDGAVLAMASLPAYDPNGFVLGFSPSERAALESETRRPLLNRAADAAYPTGSIFKPIAFVAAMEHLDYAGDTWLDCPSTFQLDGSRQRWEDWTVAEGLGPQGPMTLHQALVNSCNTIFYGIGRDLDVQDPGLLPEMAKGFGLGAPTGIPYFPETAGTVPDPGWKLETLGDGWATGDAVNLAIGQGFLSATPLQMATAYAAIGNGGDLLRPYLIAESVRADGAREILGDREVRGRLPVSAATIAEVQSALRDQTSNPSGAGSASVFADFGWPIAGKTGTAQNDLTPGKKPHSWFAAFGPYGEEAAIASAVMVESVGEGVSFAAPATRAIFASFLSDG